MYSVLLLEQHAHEGEQAQTGQTKAKAPLGPRGKRIQRQMKPEATQKHSQ
jgi:hypothetical protein